MNLFITPIDKEVSWDKSIELVSKTDVYGTILYCNESFVNVSGYEEHELAGQPHNIIRHPDMPKVIFKMLWSNISNSNNYNAVIKNLSKSGRYYWVVTKFEILKNENQTITGYISRRKGINENAAKHFDKLYERLKKIENQVGVQAAEEYFMGLLDDQKKSYDEYIADVLQDDFINPSFHNLIYSDENKIKEKKGLLRNIFK